MALVLIIDDDPDVVVAAAHYLEDAAHETLTAASGVEGLELLATREVEAVVLDLMLPAMSGLEVLERMRELRDAPPVVVLTARNSTNDVIECMKRGARDYVAKPFDGPRLTTSVKNVLEQTRLRSRVERLVSELRGKHGLASMLGESPAVMKARRLLARAARSAVTVLLLGESGTGKEVAARAIHAESPRHAEPFLAVNCGAIPASLIESQLFGHEKGAFTGAHQAQAGLFERAQGGTVFLDEIGELRLDLQVKLLRLLQERRVLRLGATRARELDLRVIAATNRDLAAEVQSGGFRQDLYYRLAVFPVQLPPLRERGEDVLLLAERFLERFARRHASPLLGFEARAEEALRRYSWPGNVRELENVIERAVLLEDGTRVGLGSLPDEVVESLDLPAPRRESLPSDLAEIVPLEVHEQRIIHNALELTGWNVRLTAERLGIGRATLYRRIDRFGLRQDSVSK